MNDINHHLNNPLFFKDFTQTEFNAYMASLNIDSNEVLSESAIKILTKADGTIKDLESRLKSIRKELKDKTTSKHRKVDLRLLQTILKAELKYVRILKARKDLSTIEVLKPYTTIR